MIALCLLAVTGCGNEQPAAKPSPTATATPSATPAAVEIAITSPRAGGTVKPQTRVAGRATPGTTVLLTGGCAACQALVRAGADGTWEVKLRVQGSRIRASTAAGDASDSVRVKVKVPRVVPPRPEAEPEITAAPPKPLPERLIVVGDSLAVGIERYLPADVFDARTGRPLAEGMEIIRNTDLSSAVLAVSLFTNDGPENVDTLEAAVRETVAAVDGCAVWATIARPPYNGVSYRAANQRLRALEAELAPKLILVPWVETVTTNPSLLGTDGVHPTPTGYQARAALYQEAIRRCGG